MERLIKLGSVSPKKSSDVVSSRIGIGFEKLDRAVFDPVKAYDKVANLGVKWIRLQSGWARTEKQEGVYDFAWLDDVVDNLISRGLKPWLCLAYGNALYTEAAKKVFGAAGCPPIHTERERNAWCAYVSAVSKHYKGRIEHYEVWNEPDGIWCWKHGVNGGEYGDFVILTANAVRLGDPDAKIIGGVTSGGSLAYMHDCFETGMGDYIDYFSYHIYTQNERDVFKRVETLRAVCDMYNPSIRLIQGESGSQSRSDGHGALRRGAWSPIRQAKQLARHTIVDLMTEAEFTSYFTALDMIEALRGTVGDKASYLDYGYFGVLEAEFDENGISSGEYKPKPSYKVLQTIASVFAEDFEYGCVPVNIMHTMSKRIFREDEKENIIYGGFKRPNGAYALAYWYGSDIMTTEFESTVSFEVLEKNENIRLIDIMDGSVYKIPDSMVEDNGGSRFLLNVPIKDSPLLLTFGDFCGGNPA